MIWRGAVHLYGEMSEVAYIFKNASRNSLTFMTIIGRGPAPTRTFHRAGVLNYCGIKRLGAKALFATHYHELTELKVLWRV
jgi:DNA mismatch repair protein MutS